MFGLLVVFGCVWLILVLCGLRLRCFVYFGVLFDVFWFCLVYVGFVWFILVLFGLCWFCLVERLHVYASPHAPTYLLISHTCGKLKCTHPLATESNALGDVAARLHPHTCLFLSHFFRIQNSTKIFICSQK